MDQSQSSAGIANTSRITALGQQIDELETRIPKAVLFRYLTEEVTPKLDRNDKTHCRLRCCQASKKTASAT